MTGSYLKWKITNDGEDGSGLHHLRADRVDGKGESTRILGFNLSKDLSLTFKSHRIKQFRNARKFLLGLVN